MDIGENGILMKISESLSLLLICGGQAISVRLVVGQLGVDEVIDLCSGSARSTDWTESLTYIPLEQIRCEIGNTL
jgi:hypothetical protein